MPATRAWSSESLPRVADTCCWYAVLELDRQRAGVEDEREVLELLDGHVPPLISALSLMPSRSKGSV